ncbi:MAG: SIR2 family protein [Dehalococcoidia bacterium]
MKRHFLDVPPYLRHLIQAIEAEYVQTPGSYLQFITELVGISGHELVILTTNYDTYIESALRMFSPKTYVYSSIQDYVRPDRQVRLAKLHGSTNWGYPFHEAYESDVSGSPWPERWIERVQYLRLPLDSRRTIIDDGKATGPAWFAKDGTRTTFLYPVLTAPLAGKDEPSLVCPEEHIIAAREFMSIPHTVLVLGSSGLDDDVLALLSNNSTNITRAKVVTKDDAPAVAERFARALGMAVEDIACYDLGFSTWMANQDFRQFADSA